MGGCVLDANATDVRIRGHGAANPLVEAPFSPGVSEQVKLGGTAQAQPYEGTEFAAITSVDRAESLAPIGQHGDEGSYSFTYRAGGRFEVSVVGGSDGHLQGPVPDVCAAGRGCKIVWGPGPKMVTFVRADPTPVQLTGEFPFGAFVRNVDKRGAVTLLEVTVSNGTLTCSDTVTELGKRVAFTTVLGIDPLTIDNHQLHIRADVYQPSSGGSLGIWVASGAGVAVAVTTVGWLWLRRRRATHATGVRSPWYQTLPLDFARAETRELLGILVSAYASQAATQALCGDAGIALQHVHLEQSPEARMRGVMREARTQNKLERLVAVVIEDETKAAYHPRLTKISPPPRAKATS